MNIDCNLALIHILRVVIDHNSVRLAVLAAELLGAQDFITGILAWDPDHIEKLLTHDAKAHQLLNLALLVWSQSRIS